MISRDGAAPKAAPVGYFQPMFTFFFAPIPGTMT
jgi:hypothetical protein